MANGKNTTIYVGPENTDNWKNFCDHQIAMGKTPSKALMEFVVSEVQRYQGKSPEQFSAARIEDLENEYRKITKDKEDMESILRRKQTSPHDSAFDNCYNLMCSLLKREISSSTLSNNDLLKLYAYKVTGDEPFDVSDWDRFIFISERVLKRNKLREIIQDARRKATGNLIMQDDLAEQENVSEEDPEPETPNETTTDPDTDASQAELS